MRSRCARTGPDPSGGAGAGERFDKLLDACENFAAPRGVIVETGVNLPREDAYRRMRSRGYRVAMQAIMLAELITSTLRGGRNLGAVMTRFTSKELTH